MYDGTVFREWTPAGGRYVGFDPAVTGGERIVFIVPGDPAEWSELEAVLDGMDVVRVAVSPTKWDSLVRLRGLGRPDDRTVLGIPVHVTSAVPDDAIALVTRPRPSPDALAVLEEYIAEYLHP